MSLEKLLSITGKPGLYELKTQTRAGFLAESLLDGKKIAVSAQQNVSLLSEIAVYTLKEELPLREVLQKIKEKENGEKTISHKESKEKLEEYFFGILPDYDEDRVYVSDIKKIIQWYNLLQEKGKMDFSKPAETESGELVKTEESPVKAIPKKAAPKNMAPKVSSSKKGGSGKNTSARKT
ncbi:MAG: hypothetical protein COZ75_10420 [Flavobacteriaceae bacterium CG_4_8_14_3_um_filter_34_10]|nr:hypothetical protein [Flavobacteriia bacterium]OIP50462.1 MAG: hypothetical protein AUK33_07620 [Flavobacteriaceae bacterium CG2_30_34_30]PIQ18227.1 MAG: hypothetical protein COW66_07460 [Flavobacteriaceae bacterium CG18_big_fil_WC_8_21_14_2_50_34_36]PIV49689.1 MAG: hypothetical protein COS19_07315 [Flavobacteriaceae bacterium CG02_land_8_20_14_3_00_34_13]PIX08735.1 MAG: hypothetical protein COZ75_10420 [Flavobacteriaceae bacterium CG_4_8_14_3_um_filter_34_10]PIZ09062.1 MAG: hypothetical pr